MAKRKHTGRRREGPKKGTGAVRRLQNGVLVRKTAEGDWEFVHPRCSLERADDMDEVHSITEMGEPEIAIDELRYLLNGCSEFIEAHALLGELALNEKDLTLARGHFGYAFEIGLKTLRRAGMPRPLPYRREANKAFFEAGKGLAWTLIQLGKPEMAREVLEQLLPFDPEDPLNLKTMLELVK